MLASDKFARQQSFNHSCRLLQSKSAHKPENQTQTGFFAIKTPFISLYIYIKKKRAVDLYTI
jgi:hypothetical protein